MHPALFIRRSVGLAVLAIVWAPSRALACPVCFGMLDGPVADGVSKAVLALMGITGAVLAGFATFFIYLVRRSRLAVIPVGNETVREGAADQIMEGAA